MEYMKHIFKLLRMEPEDKSSMHNTTLYCQEEGLQWSYGGLTCNQMRICLDQKSSPRKSGFRPRT